MGSAAGLMGLGQPAELALRTGFSVVTVTTTGTGQNSAGGLLKGAGNKIVLATVAGANGAITLPADAEIGDEVLIFCSGANTANIFSQTGGTINQSVTPNQSVTAATNTSMYCVKATSINWRMMPAGALTPA